MQHRQACVPEGVQAESYLFNSALVLFGSGLYWCDQGGCARMLLVVVR